jgi:GNAT superfamily N-acetyltransferase
MIRPMMPADRDRWGVLWQGYLDFYRADLPPSTTRRTFDRLCAREDGMFGLVAESGAELTGLVHALVHVSTWSLSGYCYLEDLFVAPSARGTSTGRELIEAVAKEAGARGAEKVYWHTQEFNGRARSLYDQVANLSSFVVYERHLGTSRVQHR